MLTITTLIVYRAKKKASGRKNSNPLRRNPEAKAELNLCTQPSCNNPPVPGLKTCRKCLDRVKKKRSKNDRSVRVHGGGEPEGSGSGSAAGGGPAVGGGI